MKRVEMWKALMFIGTLAILAILINFTHGCRSHEQTPTPPPPPVTQQISSPAPEPKASYPTETELRIDRERDAAEAAAAHARYLAQYINPGFERKPGVKALAIAVETEDGTFGDTIAAAVSQKFATENLQTVSSLFTPQFISEGFLRSTVNGSRSAITDLELSKFLDALCLAKETVDYSSNPSLANVLTAQMRVEVVAIPITALSGNGHWNFNASGAGFTRQEARALAEERISKQIAAATNMFLKL